MTKTEILANIASKVKEKIGLINKTQHGEVHEDIVNEVYAEVISDSSVDEVYTQTGVSGFNYNIWFKKSGNTVYINGFLTTPSMGNPVNPVITILNSTLFPLEEFIFYLSSVDQDGRSIRTVVDSASNQIFFNYSLDVSALVTFSGTYTTN